MRLTLSVLVVVFLVFASIPAMARTIIVPSDSYSIQDSINAASNGDTVLVKEGCYYERITFDGKAILVASDFINDSSQAIENTIIDGDTAGLGLANTDTLSVVRFVNGEGSSSVIQGFTIRNGFGTVWGGSLRGGGGIFCKSSSPTVKNNVISNNRAHHGGGIYCSRSSPAINTNTISYNYAGVGGGGIYCYDSSMAEISYNVISHDTSNFDGGGIMCEEYSEATISNNIISYTDIQNDGGGINCVFSDATIENNTIDRNGKSGMCSGEGMGIAMMSSDCVIKNNVITNNTGGPALDDRELYGESYPTIGYNNVWNNPCGNYNDLDDLLHDLGSNSTTNFNGDSCDTYYNISFDPLFTDTTTYALLCTSVCIDAGDPSYDVRDGGGRRIDMGVDEYQYIMGDANSDGEVLLGDVVYLSNYIYKGGPAPCPLAAGDCDCDGDVDDTDVVYLFYYLMKSGPAPGC